jgi:hypothetical protein
MFDLQDVVETTAFFTRTTASAACLAGRDQEALACVTATARSADETESIARILSGHGGNSRASKWRDHYERRLVEGTRFCWVLARRKDFRGWWPQGTGDVPLEGNRWRVSVTYGGPQGQGFDFELAALVVRQSTHELWTDWVARVTETGFFPPVQLPPAGFVLGEVTLKDEYGAGSLVVAGQIQELDENWRRFAAEARSWTEQWNEADKRLDTAVAGLIAA